MGNIDSLPLVSQGKSLVQWVGRDKEGAYRTQETFTRQCPVASQVRSAIEWYNGDSAAARQTQMEFLKGASAFVDGIPVMGHVKGVVHYFWGDKDGGHQAMKSASRTAGIIGGGAAGFLVGGPVGAVGGGVGGGFVMDGTTTVVDSAVHGEYRPAGTFANVTELINNPKDPGQWFDTVVTPGIDAFSGYAIGKGMARAGFEVKRACLMNRLGKVSCEDTMKAAEHTRRHVEAGDISSNTSIYTSLVRDLKTNETHIGHNRQVRLELQTKDWQKKGYRSKTAAKNDYTNAKSAVQERAPNTEPPLQRDPRACAEHHAYEKFYKSREGAQPEESRMVSVKYDPKTKNVIAIERCENCQAYSPAMGKVPTDTIHGEVIPKHPGIGRKTAIAVGIKAAYSQFCDKHEHKYSTKSRNLNLILGNQIVQVLPRNVTDSDDTSHTPSPFPPSLSPSLPPFPPPFSPSFAPSFDSHFRPSLAPPLSPSPPSLSVSDPPFPLPSSLPSCLPPSLSPSPSPTPSLSHSLHPSPPDCDPSSSLLSSFTQSYNPPSPLSPPLLPPFPPPASPLSHSLSSSLHSFNHSDLPSSHSFALSLNPPSPPFSPSSSLASSSFLPSYESHLTSPSFSSSLFAHSDFVPRINL